MGGTRNHYIVTIIFQLAVDKGDNLWHTHRMEDDQCIVYWCDCWRRLWRIIVLLPLNQHRPPLIIYIEWELHTVQEELMDDWSWWRRCSSGRCLVELFLCFDSFQSLCSVSTHKALLHWTCNSAPVIARIYDKEGIYFFNCFLPLPIYGEINWQEMWARTSFSMIIMCNSAITNQPSWDYNDQSSGGDGSDRSLVYLRTWGVLLCFFIGKRNIINIPIQVLSNDELVTFDKRAEMGLNII